MSISRDEALAASEVLTSLEISHQLSVGCHPRHLPETIYHLSITGLRDFAFGEAGNLLDALREAVPGCDVVYDSAFGFQVISAEQADARHIGKVIS